MRSRKSFLMSVLLAALACGCSEQRVREAAARPTGGSDGAPIPVATEGTTKSSKRTETTKSETSAPRPTAPMATEPKSSADRFGDVWGHLPAKKSEAPVAEGGPADTGAAPPAGAKAAKADAAVADAVVAMAKPAPTPPAKRNTPQSGILTAGSFDDNVDPQVFRTFAGKMAQHRGVADLPSKLRGERLLLIVRDSAGKPVADARILLRAGNVSGPELPTRTDGRAIFVLSWDQLPEGQPLIATITPPGGGSPIVETITPGAGRWEVTLPGTQARLPKNLDLAIVLDTTGSMGDELNYLKAEIRGISETIQQKFPEVKQRFALVLYRDQGDEYVTRSFDFTDSLDTFHKQLAVQSANGGGDYPEAVHRGLEDALQLRWREAETARVLFLVGDAPPHPQHVGKAMAAADALRRRGVALYPVACSGYDDATEFVMRSCALLTGSQFLFLTDDSGVGNAHGEPRIPYYQVERLDRLMIRTIAGELAGRRLEPEPSDVIRTVGRKVN